jgi:hypothetical protein
VFGENECENEIHEFPYIMSGIRRVNESAEVKEAIVGGI